jgi:hypothetical protein
MSPSTKRRIQWGAGASILAIPLGSIVGHAAVRSQRATWSSLVWSGAFLAGFFLAGRVK